MSPASPLPQLLDQMFKEGISKEFIKVVVNGCNCNEEGVKVIDGIEYAFSNHNAWEWSTLYEAPLRWDFDYGMLIHDTSRIEPGFKEKVEKINGYLHWDLLPATALARCLLGLYSHDFLLRTNSWLKSIDNISKTDGIIAEASGELLLRAHTALALGPQAEWKEIVHGFGDGSPRIRRFFPSINVNKFIHAGGNPKSL